MRTTDHDKQQAQDKSQDNGHTDQQKKSKTGDPDVLNRGRSADVRDIRTTVALKYNQIFLLTVHTGDIKTAQPGLGLYFHDMQYLDELTLKLNGQDCMSAMADGSRGNEGRFGLSNLELKLSDGSELSKEKLSIQRTYELGDKVTQTVRLRNMEQKRVPLEVSMVFGSHFTDMMVVRGHSEGKRGTIRPPRVDGGRLLLTYDGADKHVRTSAMSFDPAPQRIDGTTAYWPITLDAKQSAELRVTIEVSDVGPPSPWERNREEQHTAVPSESVRHRKFMEELRQHPTITTSNPLFNDALNRSFQDVQMLGTADHGDVYISGGIPWYATLFGRDSCTCAFEMAPFHQQLSKTTLLALARYQARSKNDFRDEEPGKIMHELRLGEMANLEEIPQYPYYGSVDSTPWFLMVLAEYVRWSGNVAYFEETQDHIRRALDWIDANPTYHNSGRGGFLRYGTRSETGLKNHGWKDSGNAIVNEDGSLCEAPIALVEVQGYAYRAEREMAELYHLTGDERAAQTLFAQADQRRKDFNEAFWLPEQGFYALCLERDNRPSRAVASNPGQTLFTEIADPDKARQVRDRLFQEDMFGGWGIRTLSTSERAFNPLDYQVGAFWPHDNALIMLGMWEYGFHEAAEKLFSGMFEASQSFLHHRLPECFCGFGKNEFSEPVRYPVACSPQAWSAGALPLMLRAALGLKGRAFEHRLLIHQPHLPSWLDQVSVENLRLGDATVNLDYRRINDRTTVIVTGREGKVDVDVEY